MTMEQNITGASLESIYLTQVMNRLIHDPALSSEVHSINHNIIYIYQSLFNPHILSDHETCQNIKPDRPDLEASNY